MSFSKGLNINRKRKFLTLNTQRRLLVAITLLGLFLRTAYVWLAFDESMLVYHRGDWPEYRIAAEAVMAGDWEFRHSHFLVRPPLFPILAAAVSADESTVIVINMILACAIVPMTYALARALGLSARLSLAAAFFVAIDLTSIKYSGVLLAEPLANLLLVAAFVSLGLQQRAEGRRQVALAALLCSVFTALSALTRPAGFLVWIPMALWTFMSRERLRELAVLGVIVPAALVVVLWSAHNLAYFGNFTFSTIGTFNLVYYRAASVHHVAHGRPGIALTYVELARRIEERLGSDASDIDQWRRYHHRTPNATQAAAMTDVALEVFASHPLEYLLTIPAGLFRTLVWLGNGGLWLGVVWNLALLSACALGARELWLRRNWSMLAFLILPCLYFITGTMLVQSSGIDSRARVMVTPLMAVLAAIMLADWRLSLVCREAISRFSRVWNVDSMGLSR